MRPSSTDNHTATPSSSSAARLLGRKLGFLIAAIVLLSLVLYAQSTDTPTLHALGPMNTGHQGLSCSECHRKAAGTLRQQLQANVRHWMKRRKNGAQVGYHPVGNRVCLDCHRRDNDRHSVFRFEEARFDHTRKSLKPQHCVSCHREHKGKRVTVAMTFCSNCHQDLRLKQDPIDVSHATLVKTGQWKTCLGCHDFHGNHVMKTPTSMKSVIPASSIQQYFNGRIGLYSKKLHFQARKTTQSKRKVQAP